MVAETVYNVYLALSNEEKERFCAMLPKAERKATKKPQKQTAEIDRDMIQGKLKGYFRRLQERNLSENRK